MILDLQERTAEEYLEPDPESGTYDRRIAHAAGARLRLRLGGEDALDIALAELFLLV